MGKELDSQAAEEGPNYTFIAASLSRESFLLNCLRRHRQVVSETCTVFRNDSSRPFPLHTGEESVVRTHSFSQTVLEFHGKECSQEELPTFRGG